MPQSARETHLGRAVFAAGVLVASLLAAGTAPVVAAPLTATSKPRAAPTWTACSGPALDDAGFTDVDGGSHTDNINCIAYYGITTGRTADSFAPHDNVTRSQMALFLIRMADVAGVELDDGTRVGFSDIGDLGGDRQAAINRLVNAGIVTGRTGTAFDPHAAATRAEIALFLVNFAALATDAVERTDDGLYMVANPAEDPDDDTDDYLALDHFPDAYLTQPAHIDSAIGAAFELGISIGYSDSTFKPDRAVSRQGMATFIARTLAHTDTRPAGVTSQARGNARDGYDIRVSVRDADFRPVPNTPVDVFWTTKPQNAFRARDGSCDAGSVMSLPPSRKACVIDVSDLVTDFDGNAEFATPGPGTGPDETVDEPVDGRPYCIVGGSGSELAVGPAPVEDEHSSWAWTGELDDEVDGETDLVATVVVSDLLRPPQPPKPHHAAVTGGLDPGEHQLEAKFGQIVNYTLQLHAPPDVSDPTDEHLAAGPDPSGNQYNLVARATYHAYDEVLQDHDRNPGTPPITVLQRVDDDPGTPGVDERFGEILSLTTSVVAPNANGTLTIPVTQPDPDRRVDGRDVWVSITLSPFDSTGPDADDYNGARGDTASSTAAFETGPGVYEATFSDSVLFSDDDPDPSRYLIRASTSGYRLPPRPSRDAANYVSVTVLDQYGRPVRGLAVNVVSDMDGDEAEGQSTVPFVPYFTTGPDGGYTIGYSYRGGPAIETLTAFGAVPDADGDLPERNTDPDTAGLEFPTADNVQTAPGLLPSQDRPTATVLWINIGQERSGAALPADLLVIDVENKAFVLDQLETVGVPGGPHLYAWNSADTFSLGSERVSMDFFEALLRMHVETRDDSNPDRLVDVRLESLRWSHYFPRVQLASWTVIATCEEH